MSSGGALWISTGSAYRFCYRPHYEPARYPRSDRICQDLMTKMLVIMPTAVICTVGGGVGNSP